MEARTTETESPPTVEAIGVSKRFGATTALRDISVAIQQGESRALLGRNGAGKSTLVNIITGLTRPDEGELRFAGEMAPKPSEREAWLPLAACVYQRSTLLRDLTVAENLFMAGYPRGRSGLISWRQLRAKAEEVLDEWSIHVPPSTEAHRLGVEDRQLVEIARALVSGARFVILDEPTARLEGPAIRRLFSRIGQLRAAGVTVLYISHHLDEIYEVCDTVTVLRDARIVHSGAVADLPKQSLVAAMVGGKDGEPHAVESLRYGRPPRSRALSASGTAAPALRVESLGIDSWCKDVSFEVQAGEVVGLAGLAGSGKAQVAEAIAGLRSPHAGRVLVDGVAVPPGAVRAAIAHGIGFVPQDRHADGFVPSLSIEENMTLSVLDRLGRFGFISGRSRRCLAEPLMDSLEVVASSPAQPVAQLSGGNQQKVVVGRALLTEPSVLVVVSPAAGVDVASKDALFGTLTSMPGVAVLIVSDEVDELSHCDRVLVMFDGQLSMEFDSWDERELVAAIEGVEE